MSTARARQLRIQSTEAEKKLWSRLRHNQLDGHHFRRQRPIGPFVVDFACVQQRLIVEIDGGQHTSGAAGEARRTAFLEKQGYRVLRFWNNEVLGNTDGVLEMILMSLEEES